MSQKIKPTGDPLTERLSHYPADCLGLEKKRKVGAKMAFLAFLSKKIRENSQKKKLPLLARKIYTFSFCPDPREKTILKFLGNQRLAGISFEMQLNFIRF